MADHVPLIFLFSIFIHLFCFPHKSNYEFHTQSFCLLFAAFDVKRGPFAHTYCGVWFFWFTARIEGGGELIFFLLFYYSFWGYVCGVDVS